MILPVEFGVKNAILIINHEQMCYMNMNQSSLLKSSVKAAATFPVAPKKL